MPLSQLSLPRVVLLHRRPKFGDNVGAALLTIDIPSCGVDIQLSVGHGFINILDTVLHDAASLWGHVFKRLVFNHLVGIDAEHEFPMRGLSESILLEVQSAHTSYLT